jgi:hypothetical protein
MSNCLFTITHVMYVQYRLAFRNQPTSWHIAEVQYFFRVRSSDPLDLDTHNLAVISLWSAKDEEIWRDSNRTVWYAAYQGQTSIAVIDVKDIDSCVAMVPHALRGKHNSFLVEKPSLGVMSYPEEEREDINDGGLGEQAEEAENGQ